MKNLTTQLAYITCHSLLYNRNLCKYNPLTPCKTQIYTFSSNLRFFLIPCYNMQCTKCANGQFIKSFRSKVHVKTNAEKIQLTIPQFCENNTGVKVSPFHLMDAYAYLFQATICGRTSCFDHLDLCTARSEPARTLEVAKEESTLTSALDMKLGSTHYYFLTMNE